MKHRVSAVVFAVSSCTLFAIAHAQTLPNLHKIVVATVESLTESNGDIDGFLDTNETAEIVLSLSNKSPLTFKTFSVRVTSLDPKINAIGAGVQFIPSLAAGATIQLAPITLHANAAAHRAGPAVTCLNPGPSGTCSNFAPVTACASNAACERTVFQDYSARLRIEAIDLFDPTPVDFLGDLDTLDRVHVLPDVVEIDLDLDSQGPAMATSTTAEGFENGLGIFSFQNLDQSKASNSASNGYRCQYTDPDFANSNSYGDTECYLGFVAGQNPVNDWHSHPTTSPDGGRAFLGARSLHYGKHTTSTGIPTDTISLSQLDAVRMRYTQLAARICRDDASPDPRACNSAPDCAAFGGPCVPARPQLSFKQQSEDYQRYLGASPDRAVVEVLPAGAAAWTKIYPSVNVYNAVATSFYTNCIFDPINDGNTEDDYFDPADPNRRLGPSSTCFPGFVFSKLGSTDGAFDPADIGQATDGPGLAGSLGPGTWVESRFDLSRYRGRFISVRFLFTTIKVSDQTNMQDLFHWNPTPDDDGWYIDDVRLSQSTGTTTSTVTVDLADNSSLPGATDADGDGRPDDFDCAPNDGSTFAAPTEVFRLKATDHTTLAWESAAPFAGSSTVYDVMRGTLGEWPMGSGASEICVASGVSGSSAANGVAPPVASGYFYFVRARNTCGTGPYGYGSGGVVRLSSACP